MRQSWKWSAALLAVVAIFSASLAVGIDKTASKPSSKPASAIPAVPSGGFDQDQNAAYFAACAGEGLNESACIGRIIWFKATAGNERFFTYVFQQRIGVQPDWFRILRGDQRDDRFNAWGIINDPGCCPPGSEGCPAKSFEETYGFDWCPGDTELLKYVGKSGYRDPACDLKDAPLDSNDPHAANGKDQRQSSCDLRFGTSTGALGFRKFPNPRFDATAWRKLNGSLGTWDGYRRQMNTQTGAPSDERIRKLMDASVEPPFLIGTSCGSCHIAFKPDSPPANPAHPKWENISGLVGNQYTHMSELLASGMATSTLEWQMFAHPRPGVTDTSAIPTDQVNNPGTINALINIAQRPLFAGEQITKWRKTNSCDKNASDDSCWCEPGRDGKCWQRSTRSDDTTLGKPGVHHILKGGEDSIGALEAIQRVYFNIGSCSEQCWVNHLSDTRQLDPEQRNFGQTQFDIGQCRRDCPNFRAVEDRLGDILAFFLSNEAHNVDLYAARNAVRKETNPNAKGYTRADLIDDLDREFGKDAVTRGQKVFGENCSRCHSSLTEQAAGPFATRDAYAVGDNGLRQDWLGNDQATPASEVGTNTCRALHSNHMVGHVWQQYASETLHTREVDPNLKEPHDGGRGFYRNISLLNAWAHAPFMHNNAIGPELCGKPSNVENNFHRARVIDANGKLATNQPACTPYDPSVEGRFSLYKRSMMDLLYPSQRKPTETLTTQDIVFDLGPRSWDGSQEKALIGDGTARIPAGVPVDFLGSLQYKTLIIDLFEAKRNVKELEARVGKERATQLVQLADRLKAQPMEFVRIVTENKDLIYAYYSNCTALVENSGHRFGEGLTDADKKALIAFLATL